MQQVCAELHQKVQEERQRRKMLSKEEKKQFRAERNAYNEKIVAEQVQTRIYREEERRKEIRDALHDWAECAIHIWDTRNAPSCAFELEFAAELPDSKKYWLHKPLF